MKRISTILRNALLENRACLVGFADLSDNPVLSGGRMKYGVSIAVSINQEIIKNIRNGPTQEYFTTYQKANQLLADLGHRAENMLKNRGYQALAKNPTVSKVNRKAMENPLPHKTAATRSGIGWIGKCALLITRKYGAAVRLNTVLTDAPLDTGKPIEKSLCGKCTECVEYCPAKAVSGKHWHVELHRDRFFDADACRKKAKTLAARAGIDKTVCGICIAVCPWTIKYTKRKVLSPIK
jgi:epoxyqueuosine reductase QueG